MLAAFACLATGVFYLWPRSPASRAPSPLPPVSAYDRAEAKEAEEMRLFRAQDRRDELVKLTENSFFGPSLRPLAGRPVLLAAGVNTWNHESDEKDEAPNVVKFEVVQGAGRLEFFMDYTPGDPPGPTRGSLKTLASDGYGAFAWLLTDPDHPGEVVVRATLAAEGEREAFIDPKSEVLFHVVPVAIPPAFRAFDIPGLKAGEFRAASKPHAEVDEDFLFTYPSSKGVFWLDQTGGYFGPKDVVLFHKDEKGVVAEGSREKEMEKFRSTHERWRWVPPDLRGLLTHLGEGGGRFGLLTYSRYDPGYKVIGTDNFRPTRWELGEYLAADPEAGPEDLFTLQSGEEDPNSPVAVDLSRTHRSRLERQGGEPYWAQSVQWACSTTNFNAIYGLDLQDKTFFQARPLPRPSDLKKRLEETPKPLSSPPGAQVKEDPFPALGLTFGDITPGREAKFRKLGHPPGPVVLRVSHEGPAAACGLEPDDVIVMAGWELTPSAEELRKILETENASNLLIVVYWRDGVYFQSTMDKAGARVPK